MATLRRLSHRDRVACKPRSAYVATAAAVRLHRWRQRSAAGRTRPPLGGPLRRACPGGRRSYARAPRRSTGARLVAEHQVEEHRAVALLVADLVLASLLRLVLLVADAYCHAHGMAPSRSALKRRARGHGRRQLSVLAVASKARSSVATPVRAGVCALVRPHDFRLGADPSRTRAGSQGQPNTRLCGAIRAPPGPPRRLQRPISCSIAVIVSWFKYRPVRAIRKSLQIGWFWEFG
jgi:hypothetical protein